MTTKEQTHRRSGHGISMQMLTADQLQHLKPGKHTTRYLVIEVDAGNNKAKRGDKDTARNAALREKLVAIVNDPTLDPRAAMQMLEIAREVGMKRPVAEEPVETSPLGGGSKASIFDGFEAFRGRNEVRKQDLRQYILADSTWLTSSDLSDKAGFSNRNRSAGPNGWKQRGKIFAINVEGHDRYPAYALDEAYQPLKVLKEILSVFEGTKSPWSMASWMGTANGWLDGKKPKELLQKDPAAVLHAARKEKEGAQHG
ncbi:hypothetical protein AWY96_16390 [Serratia plymuthica]|uniref:hypothetical protein n=1 Tax=Serratia plymuthica TaxID=82996 RepID=UPI0007A0113B|nr:hypothetical protein [Serratia plymuthica]KYQ94974.1 hypothetical protein AWY96_16390 [Serratia plymuthica]